MQELVEELERRFSVVTIGNYPNEWDENHITYSLMKELRDTFQSRRVFYNGFSKIIDWSSFKNKGKTESAFGDISILMNIQFSTGERLRGVGFLEAKRDSNRENFEALTLPQVERILLNAPYSHLLLYRHQPEELSLKFPDQGTWNSTIWTSPLNTAVRKLSQVNQSDNGRILRVSLPFSMLLTSRFFWGLDLDYREETFTQALEGRGDLVAPPFLAVVNVYYDGQIPVQTSINNNNWEPI